MGGPSEPDAVEAERGDGGGDVVERLEVEALGQHGLHVCRPVDAVQLHSPAGHLVHHPSQIGGEGERVRKEGAMVLVQERR